jgi:TonB family protein
LVPNEPQATAANPASATPPARVTAPALLDDRGVAYPPQALAEGFFARVEVVLVLELDAGGGVLHATIEAPIGHGFDQAALEAALQLRFSPALRGDKPVASRIRFRYVFQPPLPKLEGRVLDAQSGAPVASARLIVRSADGSESTLETAADGSFSSGPVRPGRVLIRALADAHASRDIAIDLLPGKSVGLEFRLPPNAAPSPTANAAPNAIEVVVTGRKPAPGVRSLSSAEVRRMPGAFGDPFRAIEALPGVTPIASGLPFFYVRGAPPGNVGYFLDGIRVPFLYHVALGPSVIHPALVDRVDLYAGGYPARFGRFAGGIVSAETNEPRSDTHGEANLRLFDVGGLVETGFDRGRGSALLAGRYSYTAALLSLLVPDLKLDYWDYQARLSYELGAHDRLSLLSFGSYDLLGQAAAGGLNVLFGAEFYRLDLRYDHQFDGATLRAATTLGYDRTHLGDTGRITDRSIAGRVELDATLGPRARWRVGADATLDAYLQERPSYYDPEDPALLDFERLNPGRNDSAAGVWSELVWKPSVDIEVTPGLRVDFFGSRSAHVASFDARLAARMRITDAVYIVHADGIAHQPPSFVIPVPGISPAGLDSGLQESIQTSAGVELELEPSTTANATVFYNSFFDMTDVLGSNVQAGSNGEVVLDRSLGSAVGFELFIRRQMTRKLGGFLAYTLSRSLRSVDRQRFPSAFDRSHVLNAALAYQLGRGWQAGTRLVFYTGAPRYSDIRGAIAPPRPAAPPRVVPFYRLDVRLEKRWALGATSWISFVAEMMNATLSKETIGSQRVGPITIPSLGVEAGL